MTATLERFGGSSAANSRMYWGARADWLVALTRNRDSDDITRSNWDVITEDFHARVGDEGPYAERGRDEDALGDWVIERESHWAVGWVETLLVRPGTRAHEIALEWAERLARYPVADDEHHSMLEYDEEWCLRCDRGTRQQHNEQPGDEHGWLCGKFRGENDRQDILWKWDQRKEKHDAR